MQGAHMAVHDQWAKRPDDQRYLTLEALDDFVNARTAVSKVAISDTKKLELHAASDNSLVLVSPEGPNFMTNWSFGQLASAVKTPASYLRTLPAELVEINMNYGLQAADRIENMLYWDEEAREMRAVTGPTYGRIYNKQVTRAILDVNDACGGRWKVPSATYDATNPLRATTLYASDRDMFVFLCDETNPVIVNGEKLLRGFYAWNSEVGAATFGLAQFLYRTCCDNRMLWGVEQFSEFRIKHTSGAPERFLQEGAAMLKEYAESSTQQLEAKIRRAQNFQLGKNKEEVQEFLKKFGMTSGQTNGAIEMAQMEEGGFTSAWQIAQGITAKARGLVHTDARIALERIAGNLLTKVVGNA